MLFIGNPGTGKRTAAQYVAKAFYALGILPQNKVRIVPAIQLTGQYVGQTKVQVRELFEKSTGGVLMITDLGELITDSRNQGYAPEALSAFFTEVAAPENLSSMVCIIADTRDNLEKLKAQYPMTAAFFPNQLEFHGLTVELAVKLVMERLELEHYDTRHICEKASGHLSKYFESLQTSGMVNGVWIPKVLDTIIQNHCNRLAAQEGEPSREAYNTLEAMDFNL
jgi:hypothetical protein